MMSGGSVFLIVGVMAIVLAVKTESCLEIKKGTKQGKTLTVEGCQRKTFLKEEGVVTAEQSSEEAGCVSAQEPAKTVKQAMKSLQIGIAFVPIFGCVGSNPTPVAMSERVLERLELFSNI